MEELLNKVAVTSLLEDLDNLCARLQEDYNGGEPFEQTEEDRIAVMYACEMLEYLLENRKVELK